jgi:hypothetical protein
MNIQIEFSDYSLFKDVQEIPQEPNVGTQFSVSSNLLFLSLPTLEDDAAIMFNSSGYLGGIRSLTNGDGTSVYSNTAYW